MLANNTIPFKTGMNAKFRGAEYQVCRLQEPTAQSQQQLVYRGVSYCTDGTAIDTCSQINNSFIYLSRKFGLKNISPTGNKVINN